MDSFRSYYVGQIFRTSHGFGDYWLAYQGGSEDGGSCLAQRWGLEHGHEESIRWVLIALFDLLRCKVRAITMDSFRSYYVGQIFRTSHGFGDYWLAYQGGSEDGGSCLAQRWGLEHGESRVVWAGRRVWLKALTSDSCDVSIDLDNDAKACSRLYSQA
ncbi:hypothetical protein F2Q68_00021899 [Brassica cretica]|uniref:Uncharacterized protein n=1 Tax=Brassica cretica TaxID=69181 RepID=A0A8S9FXL0_BRACR|nr:hypothetical protein F2Q68_00021899 [Brassica cretica]